MFVYLPTGATGDTCQTRVSGSTKAGHGLLPDERDSAQPEARAASACNGRRAAPVTPNYAPNHSHAQPHCLPRKLEQQKLEQNQGHTMDKLIEQLLIFFNAT